MVFRDVEGSAAMALHGTLCGLIYVLHRSACVKMRQYSLFTKLMFGVPSNLTLRF